MSSSEGTIDMKPLAVMALVALAGSGVAAYLATLPEAPPAAPRAAEAPAPAAEQRYRMSQSYSSKCSTGATICIVPAQPVGSPCSCGGTPGTIIP